jgi:hypothetical protein
MALSATRERQRGFIDRLQNDHRGGGVERQPARVTGLKNE